MRDFTTTSEHPVEVIGQWIAAWHEREWERMATFSQRYWVEGAGGREKAARQLQAWFEPFDPVSIEPPRGLSVHPMNPQVVRDYLVSILFHERGFVRLRLRLVKELTGDRRTGLRRGLKKVWCFLTRKRYLPIPNPSPSGWWGVNPISALNRIVPK